MRPAPTARLPLNRRSLNRLPLNRLPLNRLLPGLLIGLALVVVVASGRFVADRSESRVREVAHHVPAPSRGDLSSVDCPLTQTCRATAAFTQLGRATMAAAAQRHFPTGTVVDHAGVIDDSGHLVAEYLTIFTTQQVIVSVVSRCVAGAAAVPGTPLAVGPLVGPATESVVVAGRTGCGVAVIVDTPAGRLVPRVSADELAHDPAVALP